MNAPGFFLAMLPEHLVLLGIVLLLVLDVTGRTRRAALPLALVCVAAAATAALLLSLRGYGAAPFAGHFSVDPATLFAKSLVLALALPVLLMARGDFGPADAAHETGPGSEFALLLLSSLYGACLMQSADSFLTLFLGLEILSIPVYTLVLLAYRRPQSAEAALKYVVLGGTASASFLMGVSLIFGSTGSMGITAFVQALGSGSSMAQAATVLVVLSFFMKAAIVPFHAWAPDAYEAASVPVTGFMGVIVKAAVLLALVRLFGKATLATPMFELVAVLPLVSIVWGNLAAMKQPSLRRMLAYSSIAHAGYLFYVLLGAPQGRLQAVAFYLLAYGLLNLLAFAALPAADDDLQRDRLDHLKGLFHRSPYAALLIGIAMLSLAGIPPFPGFVGKFLIFKNVFAAGHGVWAVLGLVGSYLGIYFYLRVIQFMFMSPDAAALPAAEAATARRWAVVASGTCLAATLVVSLFPGWVLARL